MTGDAIKSRDLPKLSGVPSDTLRDWRRHGHLPATRMIPVWWINVARKVYRDQMSLSDRFTEARARYEPGEQIRRRGR